MSSAENGNNQRMGDDPPGQQFTGEQSTVLEQLLRLQSDIKEQCQRVTVAVNPIAEVLDTGGNVSFEMKNHLKVQILRAHMLLDDLEELCATL